MTDAQASKTRSPAASTERRTPIDRLRRVRRPFWVVVRGGRRVRWGGERRRRMLLAELALRTDATVIEGFQSRELAKVLERRGVRSPVLRALKPKSRVASAEMLTAPFLSAVTTWGDAVACAVYDDPVAQARALGVPFPEETASELLKRRRDNTRAFRWHVVPTASFAELIGLDLSRVVVGTNGTDVEHIRVEPLPERPAVGYISGAAPGRGIEAMIEAGRALRSTTPDLEVLLWLVGTGPGSSAYLDNLRPAFRDDHWLHIETTAYADVGATLGRATIMCIPHPASDYFDVALPVKLLDSMAAGRPIVVTPRTETAAIVRRFDCGLVANGDTPDDLAEPIGRLLKDETLARRLGENARRAAVEEFAWPVVGARIADEILRREGATPVA